MHQGVITYRVPLTLAISKTPLYLKIDLPNNFPIAKPNLQVMSRVVHDSIDSSKNIVTPMLEGWDIYKNGSNLLSVVRDIHQRFDQTPPIPEKLMQQINNNEGQMGNQKVRPDSSRNAKLMKQLSRQMSVIQIKEERKSDEQVSEEPPMSAEIKSKLDNLESEKDKYKGNIKEQLKVMK